MQANEAPVEIAFCCDKQMLAGLHVTIMSLLRSFKAHRKIRLYWVHNGVDEDDIKEIERTISQHKLDVSLQTIQHNVEHRLKSNSLHGSYFPYARLDLAHLLQCDRVIYLDSDLIVNVDIAKLFDYDLLGNVIGAAWYDGMVKHALDRSFLTKTLGIPEDTPYFNSGVLLIDLGRWRQLRVDAKIDDLLALHGQNCISHDQTVLNVIFGDSFTKLPFLYNVEAYTLDNPKKNTEDCIVHLTGIPKPWDPFGNLNIYSKEWRRIFYQTSASNKKQLWDWADWNRFLTISPSLAKLILRRLTVGWKVRN